jgi:hypothetical protein
VQANDKEGQGYTGPSRRWLAIQREAQLAAEQIAAGVTVLGRANHMETGLYSQAFFGLSIGLERLGKLIIVADYAIEHSGSFPTDAYLRKIGHNLQDILTRCEAIGKTVDAQRSYASRPGDPVHKGIEEVLSKFAAGSRYYNLDYIAGVTGQELDPIAMWWVKVSKPICKCHHSDGQRKKDSTAAPFATECLGGYSLVLSHAEDGTEIDDIGSVFARACQTAVVQKYGRLYTLQIVRWLASILWELSFSGAYQKGIEPLSGLNEPFAIFHNEDRLLRNRKTWSIYRP